MAVTNWANTEMGNWKLGTPGLSLTLCGSAGTEPAGKLADVRFTPKADNMRCLGYVCFVPKATECTAAK